MKITNLKPRITSLRGTLTVLAGTERIRGRRAVERNQRYLRQHPWCKTCHDKRATEVDHCVALHLGGLDSEDNLQGLCRECHIEKTSAEHAARSR